MKFYKNLTRSNDTITELCLSLLEGHNINITRSSLRKELELHPDYPSMLSLGDTLKKFHVPNIAVRLSLEKLRKMPMPYLVSVKTEMEGETYFSIVKNVDESKVKITDIEGKDKKLKWEDFGEVYGGVAFLIEKIEKSGEGDYKAKKKQENFNNFLLDLILWIIPALVILNIASFIYNNGFSGSLYPVLYQFLSLIGWCTCVFIMWYEVDQTNKALKKVCGIGPQRSNCSTVFQSNAGKVFGFSWGNIGFGYFSMSLFIQIASQLVNSSIGGGAPLMSLIAFLYVPFSIYYQKFVVRQWCRLCLAIQAVLFFQFVIVLLERNLTQISIIGGEKQNLFFSIVVGGLIPFLIAKQILDVLKDRRKLKQANKELNKSRFNNSLFSSMLRGQKAITIDTQGMGIFLGNPNAKNKIIQVCSPYCGPCAIAHDIVDELLDDENFSVQIIFTASPNSNDPALEPVRHFLSISKQGDENVTRKMLHDWYNSSVKNYNEFSNSYPVGNNLSLQDVEIQQMWNWCNKMEISFTPTFFINGNQLPDIYTIGEAVMLLEN